MTTTTKNEYRRFDANATEQSCRVCDKTKPMTSFYSTGKARKDGVIPRQSICKSCAIDQANARQAAKIAANPPRRLNLDGTLDEGLVASFKARQARQAARDRKRQKEAAERAAMRPQKLWVNPNLEFSR